MTEKHRTVSRVVGILEATTRHRRGASLTELSRELDAPRSSVHGFVKGLVAEGYLVDSGVDGRYVLGIGAHTLLAATTSSLVEILHPVMEEINAHIDETVTLSVPVGREIAYVSTVRSSHPIAYLPEMHVRRPTWPTSAGKIFLAFDAFGSDWTAQEIEHELGQVAVDELARVRDQGFATNIGESVTDVAAVAVGVALSGRLVAALSIGGPRARIESSLASVAEHAHSLLTERRLALPHPDWVSEVGN